MGNSVNLLDEIEALKRRIAREKKARLAAEAQVEERTRELFLANRELRKLMADLEKNRAALEVTRDKAIHANRAKSRFLANMSHELRTPLNAIIGYTELLGEQLEDLGVEGAGDILGRVHGSSHHLLELVNDILDLSRIEAGRVTLHPVDISIPELVTDLEAFAAPLMEHHQNTFLVSLGSPLPLHIRHDLTKLRQVLINLISNAAKFTRGGEVHLRIEGAKDERVAFHIQDTGQGIPEEQLHRIFDAFSQVDPNASNPLGSTGLGLAITRELCKLMGGDVTVASTLGEGSTFTVTLPFNMRAALQIDDLF